MATFLVIWILCSIETAGTAVAYFDGKYPGNFRETLAQAVLFGMVFGPFGSVVSMFSSGFWKYGWRLWPNG